MAWIPFSRFTVPACREEWKTDLRAMPLRVLCGWNARITAGNPMLPSWPVRRLRGKTLGRQRAWFAVIMGKQPVPERWVRRVGPPVLHPADPRHRYLDEERERVDHCFFQHNGESAWPPAEAGVYASAARMDPTPWNRAAEERGRYLGRGERDKKV